MQRIELSTRNMGWRLLAVMLLLAIGAAALSYGFMTLFSSDPGWAEIEADAGEMSYAGEFVFLYELGRGGTSSTTERKALTVLYTQATATAWKLFNNEEAVEGMPNIRYLNDHPNETVTVDAALYQALDRVARSGDRTLYLAPIAEVYNNLFLCEADELTVDFDPLLNPDLRGMFAELAAFARTPEAINLELMEDNQVCLRISEAYLTYAAEQELSDLIDFQWMLNAFVIDYLADELTSRGYTNGLLSSWDGYARALDQRTGSSYSLSIFDGQDGTARQAAVMAYSGARSIVSLRAYPMNNGDLRRFYVRRDGQIRVPYLDAADGLARAAWADLTAYATDMGCAETLLNVIPVYVAESLSDEALTQLAGQGIQSVYCRDLVVRCTDESAVWKELYEGEDGAYTSLLIQP